MAKVTIEVTQHKSFRTELEDWSYLLRRRDKLADAIERQRETRISLYYRLTPDGIRGSIIQHYDTMDMPRGSEVTDKTGNTVANSLDGIEQCNERMDKALTDYLDTCDRITRIEAEVGMLMDEPKPLQSVVTMFYRDKAHWQKIQSELNVDRSTMYRWIAEAIEMIDHSLWRA